MGGGGTPSVTKVKAQTADPVEWYNPALTQSLASSNRVAEYAAQVTPEVRSADIDEMQRMARREATINALNSRSLEEQLSPGVAQSRRILERQVLEDAEGGPSRELSNLWLKQGLDDVIATGSRLDSGFARSALADKTRIDYYNNRARIQDRLAAYLQANPQPIAGLDIGSIAGMMQRAKSDNIAAREAYGQQVLGYMGAQAANVHNALQQSAQMEAARRANNAQAVNSANFQNAAAANTAAGIGSSNSGAMTGALIGAGGAIAGGLIIF